MPDLLIHFDQPEHFALAIAALIFAYTAFSLVGFGTALIAAGPLAMLMPVARVISLLALLDCIGASQRGWRACHAIALPELKRLLPGMLLGQILGVTLLTHLPAAWMALLLGGFILSQGIKGLRQPAAPQPAPSAIRNALVGGVLGGLFGSGGFMYAAYLERALADRDAFRATQAVLIALSTAWRLLLCLLAGSLDTSVALAALCLLPTLFIGQWLGQHLDLRLTRPQLTQVLNALLLLAGISLIWRHVAWF